MICFGNKFNNQFTNMDKLYIPKVLLVGALQDRNFLEGVGLLLLHYASLSERGVKDSVGEVETPGHFNLLTVPDQSCLQRTCNK